MKKISIKTQKVIMFIPIVNVLLIFVWLYNYIFFVRSDSVLFMKSLLVTFGCSIPWVILSIALSKLFAGSSPEIINIFTYVTEYTIPLSIGFGLVKFQEKLEKKS